jgi:hypothetical protein
MTSKERRKDTMKKLEGLGVKVTRFAILYKKRQN